MTGDDTERFAFTSTGPWLVEPDEMPWRRGIDVIRLNAAREVPHVARPRGAAPVGRFVHVGARFGAAVGTWWLIGRRRRNTTSTPHPRRAATSTGDLSRRLREAAEVLGPTYIKLAQIISSGRGVFPDELVDECELCRDQVPPEDFEVVRGVIERDLGRPLEEVFESFSREPLAAASIAQVHTATLRTPNGGPTPVVVKVQRPGIGRQVRADIAVMAKIAPFLVGRIPITALANPPALVELFASTILEELDFRLEAQNMLDMAETFAAIGERGYVVPRPHPHLVTRRVLVMERFDGHPFDDAEALASDGIVGAEVVRVGMRGFTRGCILHGIFHGDLHGGNLLVMRDGRIGLLDYGICARMTETERLAFLRLTLAGGAGDVHTQLAAFRDLGALPHDTDLDAVRRDLGLDKAPVDPTSLSPEALVAEIQSIVTSLLGYGARLPKILMLYIKNLIFLDGAIAQLAPDLDLVGTFVDLLTEVAQRDGERLSGELGIEPGSVVVDRAAIINGFGVTDADTDTLTYRELKERRDTIRRRLSHRTPREG